MSGYNFQKILYSFVGRSLFTSTKCLDPGEMQPYAAFHLGFHCLQKYLFRGLPDTKG